MSRNMMKDVYAKTPAKSMEGMKNEPTTSMIVSPLAFFFHCKTKSIHRRVRKKVDCENGL